MTNKKTLGLLMPPEVCLFASCAGNYYFTEILRGIIAVSSLFKWDIVIDYHIVKKGDLYKNDILN
ncbi:hypothetical protein ACFLR5_02260, partial [Elusimicrobiota bacterium]